MCTLVPIQNDNLEQTEESVLLACSGNEKDSNNFLEKGDAESIS